MSYILVVDDSDDHLELIRLVLGPSYRSLPVRTCDTGQAALDLLATGRIPRMIFVDVNMPGLDGPATVRLIRANAACRAVPIVMLSTSDESRDIRDSLAAGANSFVRKPIALSDWGRTMGAVVDYWLLHDESARALADAG